MEKKYLDRLSAWMFLVIVGALLLLFLVVKDRSWSRREQRELVTLSKVHWSGLADGEMQSDLTKYTNDQFVFRDALMGLRSTMAVAFGERENSGVYYGHNGYLLEKFPGVDETLLTEQTDAIKAFAAQYPDLKQYMIVSPTGAEIMKMNLPAGVPDSGEEAYIASLQEKLGSSLTYIDVSKTLRNHRDEYVYYRTDHHWTSLGAYYAFKESIGPMGLDPAMDNFEAVPVSDTYQGDLQARSGYGDQTYDTIQCYFYKDSTFLTVVDYGDKKGKSASLYNSAALKKQTKLDVFFGGADPIVKINTSSPSEKRLLVFKDSSADCFVPFLLANYSEVVMIDPSLYTGNVGDLISQEGITDVLYLYHASTLAKDADLAKCLEKTNKPAASEQTQPAAAPAAEQAPAEDTSAEDTSAEDTLAEDTPAEDEEMQ